MDKLRVYVHESRCKTTSRRRVVLHGPHEARNEEMPMPMQMGTQNKPNYSPLGLH